MNVDINDRDLELRIKGHLYEIRATNDEVIGGEQGYPMSEMGYLKTLQSVATCADRKVLDTVAEEIKNKMRRNETRPENRKVRRTARKLVSESGYPPDQYLNRA